MRLNNHHSAFCTFTALLVCLTLLLCACGAPHPAAESAGGQQPSAAVEQAAQAQPAATRQPTASPTPTPTAISLPVLEGTPYPTPAAVIAFPTGGAAPVEYARWGRGKILAFEYAPSRSLLALGGTTGVILADAATLDIRSTLGEGRVIAALRFARDGSLLAALDSRGALTVWDVSSGKQLVETHAEIWYQGEYFEHAPKNPFDFSPDSGVLAVGEEGLVRFYDLKSGSQSGSLEFSGDDRFERIIPLYGMDGSLYYIAREAAYLLKPGEEKPQKLISWSDENQEARWLPSPDHSIIAIEVRSYMNNAHTYTFFRSDGGGALPRVDGYAFNDNNLIYSDNSKFAAVRVAEKRFCVWDLAAVRQLGCASADPNAYDVNLMALSSDGQLAMTRTGDEIYFWSTKDFKPARAPLQTGTVGAVIYPQDGSLLTLSYDSYDMPAGVARWALQPQAELELSGYTGSITQAAYTADGAMLILGGEDGIWIYDSANGKQLHHIEGGVTALALRKDTLAALRPDGSARVYSLPDAALITEIAGDGAPASGLAFVAGGRKLALYGKQDLTLWDASGGSQLALPGGKGIAARRVFDAAGLQGGMGDLIAADRSLLFHFLDSASGEKTGQQPRFSSQVSGSVLALDWTGGETMAVIDSGGLALFNMRWATRATQVRFTPAENAPLVVSPDSTRIALGAQDETRIYSNQGALSFSLPGQPSALAFSPDSSSLLVADASGAHVYRSSAKALKTLGGFGRSNNVPVYLAYLPQGHKFPFIKDGRSALLLGSRAGMFFLDPLSGETFGENQKASFSALVISADSSVMVHDQLQDYQTLVMETGSDAKPLGVAPSEMLEPHLSLSADGGLLASLNRAFEDPQAEYRVRLWDTKMRSCISQVVIPGNRHTVYGLALSPDGGLLALAYQRYDGTSNKNVTEIYDISQPLTPQKVKEIYLADEAQHATQAAFSPDGRYLALGTGSGDVWFYETNGWKKAGQVQAATGMVDGLVYLEEGRLLAVYASGQMHLFALPPSP